jgi:hypothetical protein
MLTSAPLPVPASPLAPPLPPIEPLIGEVTAAAAIATFAAWGEWQSGKLSARTRSAGGDLVAQLYMLRQAVMATGELRDGFDAVARERGRQALRRRCDGKLSERQIGELVDHVLELVEKVTAFARAQLN